MAKSGLRHIDVGPELTKTEWESEDSHELIHGTSFPASPVERQLFYRDDLHTWYIYNGTDWVWLGGGSGGGMEVHGNEYHDPDFASEAALSSHASAATGVHGVGSNYIAKSSVDGLNLAAHNLRHGLLGADEPNFPRIFLARKAAWVYKHWADKVGFTENNVGGSNTPSLLTLSMLTGTSANNIASLYSNDSYYLATASAGNSLGFNIFFYPNSAAWTSSLVYLGMFVTPTAPTDTQAHFGIKCLNGDVFTSIGNGSVGTQDDTGLNLAQYGVLNILGFAQQNEIKIYINNTLYKTATTNLPNDVGLYLLLYLKTTNTTQKAILVMPIQLKRWLNNEV